MAVQNRNRTAPKPAPAAKPAVQGTPSSFWQNLSAEVTDDTITRRSETADLLNGTPFVEWVRASKDDGKIRRLVFDDADKAKMAVRLVRMAAKRLGLGARVESTGPNDQGKFVVKFTGKNAKNVAPAAKHECPKCGKSISVKKYEGTLRTHKSGNAECAGSGTQVAEPVEK